MKKHITLLSGLLLVSGAFAQNAKLTASPRMAQQINTANKKAAPVSSTNKALGTVVWDSDFSDVTEWSVDNNGQTGGNFGWNINATKEGWANNTTHGIINSTSGGNFAELGNGNPTLTPGTQKLNVNYYLTTAAPIAITSPNLVLTFMQNGALFNDLQEYQISVNGTSWITVGNNSNKGVLSQSGGAAYANPTVETINLASYIPAGSTQLWVRFHWTTRFPNEATNPNVWVTYGWNIDDVAIMTVPDYDLAITNDYWGTAGLAYFKVPTTQIAPIDFSLSLKNEGGMAMTDVEYNVAITGAATFNGSSATVDIPVGADDSLFLTTTFTPTVVGTYNVARTLTSTEVDDVPANNSLGSNFSIEVTNHIYARDNGVANGFTDNGVNQFQAGNFYDIWTNQTVKGVDVRFATGTPVGSEVYARIHKIDPVTQDIVYVGESEIITLEAGQINTNTTLYLGSPLALEAGVTYFVMVGSYSPDVRISNAGTSVPQTSFFVDGDDITVQANRYYTTETPWVRLNFDPSLSVTELTSASNLSVYPNPFVGTTEVKFDLKADAKVSAVVTDLSGRTVATIPASQMAAGSQTIAINGDSFKSGIYNVTLTVGSETTTKRIVKK
ncbi:hypothetical protein D3C87_64100 [compost metagenome]